MEARLAGGRPHRLREFGAGLGSIDSISTWFGAVADGTTALSPAERAGERFSQGGGRSARRPGRPRGTKADPPCVRADRTCLDRLRRLPKSTSRPLNALWRAAALRGAQSDGYGCPGMPSRRVRMPRNLERCCAAA